MLILGIFIFITPSKVAGKEKFDTISFYNRMISIPSHDTAFFSLVVKNMKDQPMSRVKIYLVDHKGRNVFTNITDAKGSASFFIPTGRTYVIDFNDTKSYKEFSLQKIPYLSQTNTLMYDPNRFKPVMKKEIVTNPNDTIYQFNAENLLSDQKNGKVELTVRTHKKKVVPDLPVYLYNTQKSVCYASKTNSKGIAFFLLPVGTKYSVCFSDFINYEEFSLPNYPNLNTRFEFIYTPTLVDEQISNDTIFQRFDGVPESTPMRGLLSVKIIDHKEEAVVGYPIIINDTQSNKVYISYTGTDGMGYFLLPKGIKYRLSYSVDRQADYIYFKDDKAYSSYSIVFQSTGLLFDEFAYEEIAKVVPLTEYFYANLPSSSSLTAYCPPIGDQGQYGTCTAWATAYYAHYMLDAMSKTANSRCLYSPTWVYENIKAVYDKYCTLGSTIEDALTFLQNTGDVPISELPYACGTSITTTHAKNASQNRIKEFRRLFDWSSDDQNKIKSIKKSLSEKNPVVIGFITDNSFFRAGDLWEPDDEYSSFNQIFGGHAMTVVEYDDNMYGGAFRLINSWGTDWGTNGYCWVRYSDFTKNCKTAFEVFGKIPGSNTDAKLFKVELKIKKPDETAIKFIPSASSINYYKIQTNSYKNIEFEVYTQYSSYLYILGINRKGEISNLNLGAKDNFNAYLGYGENSFSTQWNDLYEWKQLIIVLTKNREDYINMIQPLFDLKNVDYKTVYEKLSKSITTKNQFSISKIEATSTIGKEGDLLLFGVEFEVE